MATAIEILVRLRDAASPALRQFNLEIKKAAAEIQNLKEVSKKMLDAGLSMTKLGTVMSAVVAIPVTFAANFEDAIKRVGVVARALPAELKKLTDAALQAALESKFTSVETAQGMQQLAQAGFQVNQIIAATPALLQLAAAGDLALADATNIVLTAMGAFKKSASDLTKVNDLLIATYQRSKPNVVQLGESLKHVAAYSDVAGKSLEETIAALGVIGGTADKGGFLGAGLVGDEAGTALKAVFASLVAPAKEEKELMQQLGISVSDTAGNFLGLAAVLEQFEEKLRGMSEAQRGEILAKLFDIRGLPAFAALLEKGSQGLRDFTKEVSSQTDLAKRTSEEFLNTVKGSFTLLLSTLEILMVEIGTPFLSAVKAAIDTLKKWADKLITLREENSAFVNILLGTVGTLGAFFTVVGTVLTSLGGLGIAIAGVTFGIKALIVSLGALSKSFLGAFVAVELVATVSWGVGKAIGNIKIQGIAVFDYLSVALAELYIRFLRLKDAALAFSEALQYLPAKAGIGVAKTAIAILEQERKAIAEEIKKYKDIGDDLARKGFEGKGLASSGGQPGTTAKQGSQTLAEALKQTVVDFEGKIQNATSKGVNMLLERRIEDLKTSLVALKSLYQDDFEAFEITNKKKRDLLDLELQKDIEALEAKKAGTGIQTQKDEIELEIFKRREAHLRSVLELEQERSKYAADLLEKQQKAQTILAEMRQGTEKLTRTQQVEKENADRIKQLRELGAAESQVQAALKLAEVEKNKVANKEKLENEKETQRIILDIRRAGTFDLQEELKIELTELALKHTEQLDALKQAAADENTIKEAVHLQELERSKLETEFKKKELDKQLENEKKIADLRIDLLKRGAGTLQEKQAYDVVALQVKQNEEMGKAAQVGGDLLTQLMIVQEKERQNLIEDQNKERIDAENTLQITLAQIKEQAANFEFGKLAAQQEQEILELQSKQAREIEILQESGATKKQILDAQAMHAQAREEQSKEQFNAAWGARLLYAGQVAGGLENIFSGIYELGGKKSKEAAMAAKAAAMAQALISGALAIIKCYEYGPIAGSALAIITAAAVGVQIAKIAAAKEMAQGGPISGGSGNKDDVPIMAMGGEFMQPVPVVKHYGIKAMEAIRRKLVPRDVLAAYIPDSFPLSRRPRHSFSDGGEIEPVSSKEKSDGTKGQQAQNLNIINVVDPGLLDSYLSSARGEKMILNVVSGNKYEINARLAR